MSKGRLLIVSADNDLARMLQLYFQSHSYEVIIDAHSKDPREACTEFNPDILIWHTAASDPHGLTAYNSLKEYPHIRTAIIAREGIPHDLPFTLEQPDGFFTIPFDVEAIRHFIEDGR